MNFRNILKKIFKNKIYHFFLSKFIINENLLKNIYKKNIYEISDLILYFLFMSSSNLIVVPTPAEKRYLTSLTYIW